MGLFDKIKDNAKTISMKAIDATREYEEDYRAQTPAPEPAAEAVIEPDTLTNNIEVVEPEAEFLVDESQEVQAPADEKVEVRQDTKQTESKQSEEKASRKSKVTEVSKAEHEKAEQEKRQAKAKQAAKERLAKSYTPSYKKGVKVKNDDKKSEAADKDAKPADKASSEATPVKRPIGIIDIAPKKFQSPAKGASYARERAALSALASQRKLNGTVPLYVTTHMNFKTRVFINRIEYSGSFGKSVLPIDQVSWVKLRAGGTGVIIETNENKRVVMVVKPADRLAFADAILKVQAMQPKARKFKDTQTVRIDQLERFNEGVDEIEKLAKLYDRGILSQEEFEAKKKQILGL